MSENVFLRVHSDIRKQLKLIAAENNKTMVSMLEDLITEYREERNVSTCETATKHQASC